MTAKLIFKADDGSAINPIIDVLYGEFHEAVEGLGKRISVTRLPGVMSGFGDPAIVEFAVTFENCTVKILEDFAPLLSMIGKVLTEKAGQDVKLILTLSDGDSVRTYRF